MIRRRRNDILRKEILRSRINDGDFGIRIVEGKGVSLAWAPRGPGWPDRGVSGGEAQDICKHLSEDGLQIMEREQNIWRLPTIDEAVRSMMLHSENTGGVWYVQKGKAIYEKNPDKKLLYGMCIQKLFNIGQRIPRSRMKNRRIL